MIVQLIEFDEMRAPSHRGFNVHPSLRRFSGRVVTLTPIIPSVSTYADSCAWRINEVAEDNYWIAPEWYSVIDFQDFFNDL